ncbi:GntR family transcriptional regulator [Oleiagrimonas sp. C23AA]|uniref:GntR family transcriptional regulator n=1 Tax=Oleiagrimonas sp. C23AA TaxID=2719047 RepID=UPI0014249CF5|nr:GntR family transcriptional regulator [Oleiagrimonas sp. C23AA]NII11305.1 GntR family transcriptional regulator [Oleiagrimonas sp. C23AA]
MSPAQSKSMLVYRQVKCGLRSGLYSPGQRIDPATLASQFDTSPTPVRMALYRLLGEGLLADHARDGLHVPMLNEFALSDLYDWMERLLLMACDMDLAPVDHRRRISEMSVNGDPVKRTWQLFDAIARATAHHSLQRAIRQTNDQLAPIRRAKQDLLTQAREELAPLLAYWQTSDIPALKSALRSYHEYRKQVAPRIANLLSQRMDDFH